MEVKVFFCRLGLRGGGRESGEGEGCWHHQKGQSLGTSGGEALLFAIFDVVGVDAIDGIEELRILLKVRIDRNGLGIREVYILAGRHGS